MTSSLFLVSLVVGLVDYGIVKQNGVALDSHRTASGPPAIVRTASCYSAPATRAAETPTPSPTDTPESTRTPEETPTLPPPPTPTPTPSYSVKRTHSELSPLDCRLPVFGARRSTASATQTQSRGRPRP